MIPLSPFGIVFTLVAALMILVLPRRWATAPLMAGVCYMVLGQGIEVGPFSFFVIRIIVLVGLMRILIKGERPSWGLNRMDWLVAVWAVWILACSAFRGNPGEVFVSNLGVAFNVCGVYFLLRSFIVSADDVRWLCRLVVILLVPIALEMLYEQIAHHNLFSFLGGVPAEPTLRNDRLRSQGPFAHAILAGTSGAVCLPLALALWNTHRKTAIVGSGACVMIVMTSASSGPLMSAIFAMMALSFWPIRTHMRAVRWVLLAGYVVLDLLMKAPAYYLLARIDLAGGSTGWHRAELIHAGMTHLSEWWLAGTDYTRHWMPTGVSWSENHTDITNHYLELGVRGGLLSTGLFIAMMVVGYSLVGKMVKQASGSGAKGNEFFAWALGASLFAHTATSIAVSYFDQSFAFIYLTLAAICTMAAASQQAPQAEHSPAPAPPGRRRPAAPRLIPRRREART